MAATVSDARSDEQSIACSNFHANAAGYFGFRTAPPAGYGTTVESSIREGAAAVRQIRCVADT